MGLAHRVVLELVDDVRLQQKGYVVVMDNFYSSPALFHQLVQRGFGAVGTARKGRRGIPLAIHEQCSKHISVSKSCTPNSSSSSGNTQ